METGPLDEEKREWQQKRWEKMEPQFRETYRRHHSKDAGWATLGAVVKNGVCYCPVCVLVRDKDKEKE